MYKWVGPNVFYSNLNQQLPIPAIESIFYLLSVNVCPAAYAGAHITPINIFFIHLHMPLPCPLNFLKDVLT